MLAGAALVLSSVAAAAVAARNADTIADARDNGLGMAQAATNFRTHLANADALAAGTLITGGLETTAQRADYDEQVLAASEALTQAGLAATDDDEELVNALSDGLVRYAGLVETSRANSRQGFPVGAAYLDQASAVLRSDVLPQLDELVQANSDRVDASFDSVGSVPWLLALGILALAALVVVQVWLARRTHRRLNAGLFWSTVLALAATIAGAFVLGSTAQRAADVRNGPYDETVSVSNAYSLANDAKSQESFTLIKRGSGAVYEEQFVAKTDEARDLLVRPTVDDNLVVLLNRWVASHEEIRALDDGGDWDGAVALAISEERGAPNDLFAQFSTAASSSLESSAAQTHDALSGSGGSSVLVGWLMLVAGVLAAVLSWRGISTRVEEYR